MSDDDEHAKTHLSLVPKPREVPAQASPEGIGDRYLIPEGVVDPRLGEGGMGRVLRLHDPTLEREVAVKELLSQHRADATVEALFVREAKVLARLEHPGVVPVFELGRKADGTPYYAMRRVRGDSLATVLEACATLSDRLALASHFLDVVQTVGYAHTRGVVHRDLKPDNVMVSRFGETLVIDWGLAVVDGQLPSGLESAGTPAYMAPEQARGEGVSPQSDVWSLGVMLYELLTGQCPFSGTTASDVVAAVKVGTYEPIRAREPKAPRPLALVAERALQARPADRYANAGEMADALEAALGQRVSTSRGPLLVAVALAGALAVALGWGASLLNRLSDTQRDASLKVTDAERARGQAAAAAALRALRDRDALTASRLAGEAGAQPLARGVELMARELGVPRREWAVTTEAGCSSLTLVDGLAACGTLNGVALYQLVDGKAVGTLSTGPRGWVQGVAALPDHRLAAGGDDRVLRVFDVAQQKLLSETKNFPDSITAVAADGEHVVVGLRDGQVFTDATAVGATLVQRHPRPVLQLVASHGALGSTSGAMVELSRPEGNATLDRRAGALAFVSDGVLLGVERTVALLSTAGASATWGAHRHDVTAATAFGTGEAVTGSADGELRWWSKDGQLQASLALFPADVRALAALSGGTVVAVAGRALEAWTYTAPRPPAWEDAPTAARVIGTGGQVYAGFRDGRVRRFEVATGLASTPLELRHTGALRALVEVPASERPEAFRLVSGGDEGRVMAQRWNGETEILASESGRVLAVAVGRGGERAAWAVDDGSLVLHSLSFEKEIARTKGSVVRALAFSPDGRTLAVGRGDKRLALYGAEDGRLLAELDPLDAELTAVAWASDGVVVAGAVDGAVTAWDVATKALSARYTGPTNRVAALAVSGDRLAAGTHDGQAWVWNVARGGAPDYRVPVDCGDVLAVGFAGDALVVVGTDRMVHLLGR